MHVLPSYDRFHHTDLELTTITVTCTSPSEFFNRSLYSILQDEATWADNGLTNALQEAVLKGNHSSVCNLHSDGTYSLVCHRMSLRSSQK